MKMSIDGMRSLYGGYWRYNILDFHYLMNHYFPTKEMYAVLQKELPMLCDNYPSCQKVIAKLLSKWKSEDYFNEDNLIVSNGSSELIRFMSFIINKATIPIPTFNEYVKMPANKINFFYTDEENKFKIEIDKLIEAIKKSKSDFVVLVNPNNPVGNILTKTEIKKLLDTGVKTIVDEAFIDFSRENSVENLVKEYDNLIIITTCTKTMGLSGLRLGYMLTTNNEIKEKIRNMLPIWNINSLAERFIELFTEFEEYYWKSIERTVEDKKYLFKKLKEIDYLEPFESHSNFIFCKTTISARRIAEHLFDKHRIMIKDGLNQKNLKSDFYIRIGIKTKSDNDKLISGLKGIIS